jgi:N-alpha-acetyl-L-2,4-diaminobutyrate deacetylase
MELWDELRPSDTAGKVVMVPVANPPAFAAHRRTSPIDGLDLNRIFPGKPDGSASERIADRLFHAILKKADFVFSMHSWYAAGLVLPYVEYKHRIATAEASLAAAKAIGFEIIRISDWSPGLLTRAANEAGIPGIEAEIGGTGISSATNRARYKAHVRALMAHLGMSQFDPPRQATTTARLVDHVDVMAPAGGILHLEVALGAEIRPQERLGRVTDFHGTLLAEIFAKDRGIVGALRSAASVSAGDLIFRIFRDLSPL